MKRVANIIGYLLALVVIAWVPAAVAFVIMGIWGDDRWFVTGCIMITVAAVVGIITLMLFQHKQHHSEQHDPDWSKN